MRQLLEEGKLNKNLIPEKILVNLVGRARIVEPLPFPSDKSNNENKKWCSPEAFNLSPIGWFPGFKSEVFNVGMLALYCFDYKNFNGLGNVNLNEKSLELYLDTLKSKIPFELFYVIKSMLAFSPFSRPKFEHLYQDFVKNKVKTYID